MYSDRSDIPRVMTAGAIAFVHSPRQTRLTSIADKLAHIIHHLAALNVEKPACGIVRGLESRANESGSKECAYGRWRVGRRRRLGKSVGKCLKEIALEAGETDENAGKRRGLLNVRWCGAWPRMYIPMFLMSVSVSYYSQFLIIPNKRDETIILKRLRNLE